MRRHNALRDQPILTVRSVARKYGAQVLRECSFPDPPLPVSGSVTFPPHAKRLRHSAQAHRQASGDAELLSIRIPLDMSISDSDFSATPQGFYFSVISPPSSSSSRSAHLALLAMKEREKRCHYQSLCAQYGLHLLPVVIDAYDCTGAGFDFEIQQVANFIAVEHGTSPIV